MTFDFQAVFAQWPVILEGLILTIKLSASAIVLGSILAFAFALMRQAPSRIVRGSAEIYVEAIRNSPLLVQLLLLFFGLPYLGIRLSPDVAGLVGLSINLSGYASEIFRAGIESVPSTQREAGHSLGLTRWQILRYVILRQALANVWPALSSQYVLTILGSSVCSFIAAVELSGAGSWVHEHTFRNFEVYIVLSAIYLALSILARVLFAGLGAVMFSWR